MEDRRPIVTTVHGSHLYGTTTPTSDRDYKGVHLPSGMGILLQRPEEVIDDSQVVKNAQGKNTGDAIDRQSYSLQKFARMIADGDGVATEILFAPDWAIVDADDAWDTIRAKARTLINRDIKGFVGYCKMQAAKYGVKGSRMAAVRVLVDALQAAADNGHANARLEIIENELQEIAETQEHVLMESIPTKHGVDMLHVICCDRKMAMRTTVKEALKVYSKVWDNYGSRARMAMTNEGIDWKAVSHAVRVARQARELLETGSISFPRPDAEELLAIKMGRFEYSTIQPMLEELVDGLDQIESTLPVVTTQAQIDELVLPYYQEQTLS